MRLLFILLLGLLLIGTAQVSAQTQQELRSYQRNVIEVTSFVADRIASALTPEERAIQRSLRVRVPLDSSFTAQATQGRITMSAGIGWIFQQLAAAQIAEQFLGFRGCSPEYLEYFAINVIENSDRAAEGRSVNPVLSPGGFGRRYGGACRGFDDRTVFHPDIMNAYAAQMNASLTFLYLHELAHHTLGHLESGNRTLSISREQEAAADRWAIRIMVESDLAAPAAALPMMRFLVLLGGETLEDERRSTHPLGMRRMRDSMRYAAELHRRRGDHELADETLDAMEAAEEFMP